MARFVEFKQPIGLEERAEKLSREISDMENSVDELTGVQAESCKQALDHTNEIARRLAVVQFFFPFFFLFKRIVGIGTVLLGSICIFVSVKYFRVFNCTC